MTQPPHKSKATVELSQSMRLGLLLSDAAASHGNVLKELVQLVKLGLLLHDAVVSRRKASMEQSWFGQEWSLAA